jgi:hypothetical protein
LLGDIRITHTGDYVPAEKSASRAGADSRVHKALKNGEIFDIIVPRDLDKDGVPLYSTGGRDREGGGPAGRGDTIEA